MTKKHKVPHEANLFDKIIKENIELTILPMLGKLTGIKFEILKRLTEKLQTTTEREADYLAIILDDRENKKLLHLEFQTNPDANMIYRIGEYHGILQRKYKLPILHIVLFLGDESFNGPSRLDHDHIFREFVALDFHKLSYKQLLDSEIPEEVILAVLADFEGHKPSAVFRLIFQKLKSLTNNNQALKKYILQLANLSRLRNLTEEFTQIHEIMPITYDINTDAIYKKGIAIGATQGIEKGIEKELLTILSNLKKEGVSIEKMMVYTGRSKKEILKYLNQLNVKE